MSYVHFEIIKKDDRLFFYDGEQYVLFDSGFMTNSFGKNSASVSGKIGPFKVKTMGKTFFSNFINLTIGEAAVTAVLNPMDGYNCLLKGNTLTISDKEMAVENGKYFFDFTHPFLPLIEGSIGGIKCSFFFDSGARITMFGERADAAEKVRTYTEWMAMKHSYANLDVYKVELGFPNGFEYKGEGALVTDAAYLMHAKMLGIRAMLGIDIFNHYDMAIITRGAKRGIMLLEK